MKHWRTAATAVAGWTTKMDTRKDLPSGHEKAATKYVNPLCILWSPYYYVPPWPFFSRVVLNWRFMSRSRHICQRHWATQDAEKEIHSKKSRHPLHNKSLYRFPVQIQRISFRDWGEKRRGRWGWRENRVKCRNTWRWCLLIHVAHVKAKEGEGRSLLRLCRINATTDAFKPSCQHTTAIPCWRHTRILINFRACFSRFLLIWYFLSSLTLSHSTTHTQVTIYSILC